VLKINDQPTLYVVLIVFAWKLQRTLRSFNEISKYQMSTQVINEQRDETSDIDQEPVFCCQSNFEQYALMHGLALLVRYQSNTHVSIETCRCHVRLKSIALLYNTISSM
jgi:hypothetical protein